MGGRFLFPSVRYAKNAFESTRFGQQFSISMDVSWMTFGLCTNEQRRSGRKTLSIRLKISRTATSDEKTRVAGEQHQETFELTPCPFINNIGRSTSNIDNTEINLHIRKETRLKSFHLEDSSSSSSRHTNNDDVIKNTNIYTSSRRTRRTST